MMLPRCSEAKHAFCLHCLLPYVSVQVGDGVFEVLSTSGDTHLGGDDFDRRIVDYLADDFQRNENIDLRKDRQALQRLTEAAEKAKMELSTLSQVRAASSLCTYQIYGQKCWGIVRAGKTYCGERL